MPAPNRSKARTSPLPATFTRLGYFCTSYLRGISHKFSARFARDIAGQLRGSPELPSRVVGFPEYVLPKYSGSEAFASVRGTTSEDLGLSLAGDLDNIIMKALSKNPADRYESVRGLSEDIARHLRGQEIVAGSFDADQSPADFSISRPQQTADACDFALQILKCAGLGTLRTGFWASVWRTLSFPA